MTRKPTQFTAGYDGLANPRHELNGAYARRQGQRRVPPRSLNEVQREAWLYGWDRAVSKVYDEEA